MESDLFKPTEYTAALLHHLRRHSGRKGLGRVLEIGTGSGVVMACLAAAGAQHVLGVEIEAAAVAASRALLQRHGLQQRTSVVQGDMWLACGGGVFDMIVSNLPQFPASHVAGDGRLVTWSAGGGDGRRLVDRFLLGLPAHLAAGGLAVMTHNVFIDLEKTRLMARELGLQARVVSSTSVPLSAQKLASMNPAVRDRYAGRGIHNMGPYWFADFDIVEIGWEMDALADRQ
jgi:methylase of polypeptide subunit release factors